MPVAYGSADQAVFHGASYSVTKPSGTVSGDILVAFQIADTPSLTSMTLTGGTTWNLLTSDATNLQSKTWWKFAGGSEPASYTVGQVSNADGHTSIIRATAPHPSATPVFAVNYTAQTGTAITSIGLTPTGSDDLLIRFIGAATSTSFTAPASHTERTDSASATFAIGTTATRQLSSSAATGTATFTASPGATKAISITVAIASEPSFPQTVTPSGITSGEAFGTAQLNFTIVGSGIASSEAFGSLVITTPQVQTITPTGIASEQAFGTLTTGLFLGPSGIASGEVFGTAGLSAVIGPTGIASLEAFGSTNVAIQQFISPSGIASLEAIGVPSLQLGYPQTIEVIGIESGEVVEDPTASLLHDLVLTNPSIQETPAARNRLFARYGLDRGITIMKDASGVWSSVRYPAQTEIEAAQTTYMGGHRHRLTTAEAEELILADYGPYITLELIS